MADHNDHDDMAMMEISAMTGQVVHQLCDVYGQCVLHTTMTIIKDAVESIEASCIDAEEEGKATEHRTKEVRAELAEMLRGLANIIKPEGAYDVTTTKH